MKPSPESLRLIPTGDDAGSTAALGTYCQRECLSGSRRARFLPPRVPADRQAAGKKLAENYHERTRKWLLNYTQPTDPHFIAVQAGARAPLLGGARSVREARLAAVNRAGVQMKVDLTTAKPEDVRVLVAGCTGYIGRFVTKELLKRGYQVSHALSLPPHPPPPVPSFLSLLSSPLPLAHALSLFGRCMTKRLLKRETERETDRERGGR